MTTPRTEKNTIAPGKDPLEGVSYSRPQPQPPINDLISDTTKQTKAVAPGPLGKRPAAKPAWKPKPKPKPRKAKITVVIPIELLERVRDAAWWERESLAGLAEEGLRLVVEKLERQNGGPFGPRKKSLKPGRPQGSKNFASQAR